jgi:hypothetical protein
MTDNERKTSMRKFVIALSMALLTSSVAHAAPSCTLVKWFDTGCTPVNDGFGSTDAGGLDIGTVRTETPSAPPTTVDPTEPGDDEPSEPTDPTDPGDDDGDTGSVPSTPIGPAHPTHPSHPHHGGPRH